METLRILGQVSPAADTNGDLIVVPSAVAHVLSSLVVCNTSTGSRTFRVHARPAGAATATGNAIIYDNTIAAGETIAVQLGITLAATDVLTVRTSGGTGVTYTAFGSEVEA